MSWYLYLLECSDGSIYTGITVDVQARYAAHAAGKGARYTRSHPPLRLLAAIAYPDRSAALKAEYAMKQLSPAAKRKAAHLAGKAAQPAGKAVQPGGKARRPDGGATE